VERGFCVIDLPPNHALQGVRRAANFAIPGSKSAKIRGTCLTTR